MVLSTHLQEKDPLIDPLPVLWAVRPWGGRIRGFFNSMITILQLKKVRGENEGTKPLVVKVTE